MNRLHEDGHQRPGEAPASFRRKLARPAAIQALADQTDTTPAWVAATAAALFLARLAGGPVALGLRQAGAEPLVTPAAPPAPNFRSALRRAVGDRGECDDTPDYVLHGRPLTAAPLTLGRGETLSLALLSPPATAAKRRSLWIEVAADPAVISPARTETLCRALARFLDAVAKDPDADPSRIALADRHHRAPTLDWQPPGPDCPLPPPSDVEHITLADLFGAILARWPNRLAIATPSRQMRFVEVDRIANALAETLSTRGARPGDVVAIRLSHPTPPASAALYPCLTVAARRLGCAILPLGQQIGARQAQAQVAHVGARFLVSASASPDCEPAWLPGATRDPIETFPDAVLFSAPAPVPAATTDAAILLTTSGTTGQPRTVMLSDAMILGFLTSLIGAGLMPAEPGLLCPNIGFDLAIADIWLPWSLGRHVVLLDTESRAPAVLADARALGARVMSITPTQAAAVIRDDAAGLAGFVTIFCVGEAFPPALARRLQALYPTMSIVNGYGPSEVAILSSAWRVDMAGESRVPIGPALPFYRVLVADTEGRPLPPHWPGELLIAPTAPAPGYLDPVARAQRFAEIETEEPGPFFRSGDWGWIDAQGRLQFIGRRDRQSNASGLRVELDDVEGRIGEVPGVADCAVVIAGERGADARLVALVQRSADAPDDRTMRERIRAHCSAWLHRGAVPTGILFVDSIPLSPSGKKDYRTLAAQAAVARPAAATAPPHQCPAAPKPGSRTSGNGFCAIP